MKRFKTISMLIITVAVVIGLGSFTAPAQADAPASGCVIVHRGQGHAENTISNFKRAINHGACGIEADVRSTSDHVKVLNHDATLNRTTNGTGRVSSRSWHYVSRLRVGHTHAHVATYQQVLILCRDSRLQVCMFEAKKGMSSADVLTMAQDAVNIMGDKLYKVTIETDTFAQTRTIENSEFKQVSTAFVGFNSWPNVSDVKASGADGIIVNRPVMSRARVASAAQHGLWVTPYTIETRKQFARVRHMGSHGAMTDSSPSRLIG
jgi:glycerophosphoryl diester phosphodiesterase